MHPHTRKDSFCLDDDDVANALTRIVSARSLNNVKATEISFSLPPVHRPRGFCIRVTKAAKALRAPGEVGNDFWTTRGQVLSALSSGGEKAC